MRKVKTTKRIAKSKISLFQAKLLSWFKVFGRHHLPWRKDNLPSYEIVIAEVLLQRTKAETIERFYPVFLSDFPSWQAIANTETSILEQYLKPLGLYRQKARRLKDLAIEMVTLQGQLPIARGELEKIPFLGQYITNAIELLIFKKPSPLLDVNMARVLERYFGPRQLVDIRFDPYLQQLAAKIVDHPQSKEINWAMLDFAAAVCKSQRPECIRCLLSSTCIFGKNSLKLISFVFICILA